MRNTAVVILSICGWAQPLAAAETYQQANAARPILELHSWQDAVGEWRFAVLANTSGEKTTPEMFDEERMLRGVPALLTKISELPFGAVIIPIDRIPTNRHARRRPGTEVLRYPPPKVLSEL